MMDNEDGTLTDADVTAIINGLEERMVDRFEAGVGRGVLYWVKRAGILILIVLAMQGLAGDKSWFHTMTGNVRGS